jgi:hypothetical protein
MVAQKISVGGKPGWIAQKAKLRVKFPKLTDADLNYDESRKREMLNSLEIKLAMTSQELQVIIETL